MDDKVNCVLWLAKLKSVSVVRKEFNLCFNVIYNLFLYSRCLIVKLRKLNV